MAESEAEAKVGRVLSDLMAYGTMGQTAALVKAIDGIHDVLKLIGGELMAIDARLRELEGRPFKP